jgi:hypothetical protein
MITFSNGGRLGNQLFQYVSARLLAEKIGFYLGTAYNGSDTLTTTIHKSGKCFENNPIAITETKDIDNIFDRDYEARHYHLIGYWQNADYYLPYRNEIINYFNEKALEKTNKKDIVIHVRLGDYKQFGQFGNVLHPDYYLDILKKEDYENLFIVTDEIDEEYFSNFEYLCPIYVNESEKSDFWFLTGFDRIIISNSTFAWWAAFLSNASKIYTPSCWIRNCNDLTQNLTKIQNGIVCSAGFLDYVNFINEEESCQTK